MFLLLSLDSIIVPTIAIMSVISTCTISIDVESTENLAPALTTIYTPPSRCWARWVQLGPLEAIAWSGAAIANTIGVPSSYWLECVPYQLTDLSPGVCLSGQTPNTISVVVFQKTDQSVIHTEWNARCCPKQV
jgi:hypothetical protein